MKKAFVLSLILLLFGSAARAANHSFTATLSQNPVTEGHRFKATYTLRNANGSSFKAPSFRGFEVLSGPNQSQMTSYVNGRRSSEISYSFILSAKSVGTFPIQGATIVVDGEKIKSNTLEVKVVEPSEQEKIQRQQQKEQDKEINTQARELIRKNIFIKLNVSKKEVYQGEQLVVEYKLYVNPNLSIVDYTQPKTPMLNGFWSQDIENEDGRTRREMVDGVMYNVNVIKKVVLLPQKTGKLKIDPSDMDVTVRFQVPGNRRRTRSRDPFDSFFNDPFFRNNTRDFDYTVTSGSASVKVLPMPENPPLSFDGGVGKLDMIARLDNNKTKENEPVSLKVKISGAGNLKLIEPFDLNLPPDIENFDPKITEDVSVTASGITGSKTFEYLLIPRRHGEYDIDPIEYTYFDLEKKKYVTLKSEPFHIFVEKGEGTPALAETKKEDLQYIDQDIRFIKEDTELAKDGALFFGSASFYAFIIAPGAMFILFFFYMKKRGAMLENQELLKNKRATKTAKKKLAMAGRYLSASNKDKFFEETSNALWGYLSDKLAIPYADLTKDKAAEQLLKKDVDDELIISYLSVIDDCEYARFAPMQDSKEKMDKTYKDAENAITELEGKLK